MLRAPDSRGTRDAASIASRAPPIPEEVRPPTCNEVLPGVLHWTTHHEGIGTQVHSHFAVESAALIDPRVPDGGVEEVAQYGRPERILLSNRHHLRHSERFADEFGCPIRCHEAGLHEFDDGARRPAVPLRRRGRAGDHGARDGRADPGGHGLPPAAPARARCCSPTA